MLVLGYKGWRYSTLSRQQYIILTFHFCPSFYHSKHYNLYTLFTCSVMTYLLSIQFYYLTTHFTLASLSHIAVLQGNIWRMYRVIVIHCTVSNVSIQNISNHWHHISFRKEWITNSPETHCLAFSTENVTCSCNWKQDFCQTSIPLQC